MNTLEIRNIFINYFKEHDHVQIPSAKVIPTEDSSVLFTTAGMQQLVPYLTGEKHPKGNRLVDYQKCVRTNDIDEVGDNRHLTFFEMLGNWSLGAYFKEESIKMSYDLLVNYLNIPSEKLSVTCFEGDENAPKDLIAAEAWKNQGIPSERIYFFGKSENWWIAGETGPCGPDTEIFYDTGAKACSKDCNPSCECGKYIEIWNNVFMEYYKDENGYSKLKKQNVDTGMGLERISMLLQGKETPFDLEMFLPVMEYLESNCLNPNIESRRIVSEHFRTSAIIIADGGIPSNVDRGYILRRLIRRAIRHLHKMNYDMNKLDEIINLVIDSNSSLYPEMEEKKDQIVSVISQEKDKFFKTLVKGEREFEKLISKHNIIDNNVIPSNEAFKLYETYGLPIEITIELAKERNIEVNTKELEELFKKHQEKSRQGSEKKFKGGLADHKPQTIKYHTATHLLHQALRDVLGEEVHQKGSNITTERLRFDFNYDQKMTPEQISEVENIVNSKIKEGIEVINKVVPIEEARKMGAIGLFEGSYGGNVSVYLIGDYSKEFCGGPHVKNTKELGEFKIVKEQASSKGVRRIKAILK